MMTTQDVECKFDEILHSSQHAPRHETAEAIRRYFSTDDVEVAVKRVSLICPVKVKGGGGQMIL